MEATSPSGEAPTVSRQFKSDADSASPAPTDDDEPGIDLDAPSEADLAEMFGGAAPIKEDDYFLEDGGDLPDIENVRQRIPAKTQVLMQELFRARLDRVQRVNPKKIR